MSSEDPIFHSVKHDNLVLSLIFFSVWMCPLESIVFSGAKVDCVAFVLLQNVLQNVFLVSC